MAHSKTLARSRNAMSDEWWVTFNKMMGELEVLEALDFDDATAQAELVMTKCLGVKKEVATPHEPAQRASMTNATLPSSVISCCSKENRLPIPFSRQPCCSTTSSQAASTCDSILASQPTSRRPPVCHSAKPLEPASGSSVPRTSMQRGSKTTQVAASAPNLARPTKASLRAGQPTERVPSHARPTKASVGAYQPPVKTGKPISNANSVPESLRLAYAIHGPRANQAPDGTKSRWCQRGPSPAIERAPPVPPKSAKRLMQNRSVTMPILIRSDSVHSPPRNIVATAPRCASPAWNTSPSIYTSTKLPLKVNGTYPSRFLLK
jgi:hypothetical protein